MKFVFFTLTPDTSAQISESPTAYMCMPKRVLRRREDHQACDNNSDQEQNLDPPEAAVAEKTNGFIVSGDDIAAGDDLCQPESGCSW